MPTNVQELLSETKCFACYSSASTTELLKLVLLSKILDASGGGGGGGGAGLECGNYAGGEPDFTPTTDCGVAIDTSNERIWWYYNSAWH